MQIGSSNLLSFLPGSTPQATGQTTDQDADTAKAVRAKTGQRPLSGIVAEPEAAGVILHLQAGASTGATPAKPNDLVYGDTRRTALARQADTERMALQHSQTLQRSAAVSSSLGVDKDGVLVALPTSAAEVKVQAFMHHAVSTMRSYADEQERLKAVPASAGGAATSSLIPRSLAEVHKLAARFRLFA